MIAHDDEREKIHAMTRQTISLSLHFLFCFTSVRDDFLRLFLQQKQFPRLNELWKLMNRHEALFQTIFARQLSIRFQMRLRISIRGRVRSFARQSVRQSVRPSVTPSLTPVPHLPRVGPCAQGWGGAPLQLSVKTYS